MCPLFQNTIQMNIFEVLATDSSDSNSLLQTLGQAQHNWALFRKHTCLFLDDPSPATEARARDYWAEIIKTSPEIAFMATQFYLSQLKEHITSKVRTSMLQQISTESKIYSLCQTVSPNMSYVQMFKNDFLVSQVTELTKQMMNEFDLRHQIKESFTKGFRHHCKQILVEEMIDFEEATKDFVTSRCQDVSEGQPTAKTIKEIFEQLHEMSILDWCAEICYDFLNADLNSFVETCVDPSEGKQFHRQCLNYQRTFQKSFMKAVSSEKTHDKLKGYIGDMDHKTYFLCGKFSIEQILDLILDFPDSYPAIMSLKECIERSQLLNELSDKLVLGVEKRLLIPGVLTHDILNQYINMLKVLQIIDPHGFIFDRITLPIKNYLLRRNDTLRCIISFLTDDVENYSKLTKEFVKIPSKEYIQEVESDEDEHAAERWEILAMKENKTRVRVKYQKSDLVTVLVNLYGSQQAFINEYQNMLAEKLMSAKDYNIDEEIKNIQLLKIRFGETALQTCNIIVKDVKDSKRLDKEIHASQSSHHPSKNLISLPQMNCLAVSKGYWPINYEASNSHIPSVFKDVFDEYAHHYAKKKAMRKIEFHYNLGHVNLTLTFLNGEFDFKCMPVHAMMISCFEDKRIKDKSMGVSSEELSGWLNLPQNVVKQKMSFWVHKGVVKQIKMAKQGLSLKRLNSLEDGDLVYYRPVDEYQQVASNDIDDDIDNLIIKESTSMESHLKHIIEGLVISILNINGPKSPEKIHLLLKTIYKTDLDYTYGEAQTIEILKKMAEKRKIDFNGDTYSTRTDS